MVLVLIGYSTYALIFIRSNQDPGIDENDPETANGGPGRKFPTFSGPIWSSR